jgi:hypothetical protein
VRSFQAEIVGKKFGYLDSEFVFSSNGTYSLKINKVYGDQHSWHEEKLIHAGTWTWDQEFQVVTCLVQTETRNYATPRILTSKTYYFRAERAYFTSTHGAFYLIHVDKHDADWAEVFTSCGQDEWKAFPYPMKSNWFA